MKSIEDLKSLFKRYEKEIMRLNGEIQERERWIHDQERQISILLEKTKKD